MSAGDTYLRRRARRRKRLQPQPDPELEPKPKEGLVSQGVRSQGTPWLRRVTPDDLIRQFRRSEPGRVWTPL